VKEKNSLTQPLLVYPTVIFAPAERAWLSKYWSIMLVTMPYLIDLVRLTVTATISFLTSSQENCDKVRPTPQRFLHPRIVFNQHGQHLVFLFVVDPRCTLF
jgi:hypothetical protein